MRFAAAFSLLIFASGAASAQSPEPLIGRVQELIGKGDLGAARDELTRQLKTRPADPLLYNLLGVVEAQSGQYHAAESAFQNSIRLAPRSAAVYENLGRLYQENVASDPDAVRKGIDTYKALLRLEPANAGAHFRIARLLAWQGSYAESRTHLLKLPPGDLEGPSALAVLCAVNAAAGDSKAAQDAASRLLKHPELSEGDITSVSPVLDRAKAVGLEAQLLQGLVARGLASPGTLRRLSALYESQGNLPKAREALEAAPRSAGSVSVDDLLSLARIAYKQRDFNGTLGYLAHARDLDPRNAGIHFFFGLTTVELNLPYEAEKSLAQAVALSPSNPYYQYAMGAVEAQLGKYAEAVPYFEKYCEAKPADAHGKLALASAYFQTGQDEVALKYLNEIAGRPETAPATHYYLGRIAMRDGETERARREFEQSLAANPKFADAYAELGLLHLEEKKYADAEKAFARATGIDPDNYRANLNLLVLYRRTKDPRAEQQAKRVGELKEKRSEDAKAMLRGIEVRPY